MASDLMTAGWPRLNSEKRLWVAHLSRPGRDPCGFCISAPSRCSWRDEPWGFSLVPFLISNFHFLAGAGLPRFLRCRYFSTFNFQLLTSVEGLSPAPFLISIFEFPFSS